MTDPIAYSTYLAIGGMALVTMFTRLAGYWMMGRVTLTPRTRRMLEALPGSVVAALVVPVMLKEGSAAIVAMAAVVLVMIWRRNEFIALATGLAIAAGLRALGV